MLKHKITDILKGKYYQDIYFPAYSGYLFAFLFLLVAYFFRYDQILFLPPYSAHMWRQCDSLSIALNYFNDNRPFFEPAIQNLGGNLDNQVVGEFPGLYFMVAQLWKVFGYHEFLFRGLSLVLFFTGSLLLYRIVEKVLHHSVYALFTPLMLFSTPIVAYYGINFLVNVPVLSFVLMGWYFFYFFYKTGREKWLWITMLFFTVAGLHKITGMISYVALLILFIIELLFSVRMKKEQYLFKKDVRLLIPFGLSLIIILVWIGFVQYYNSQHFSNVFNTKIFPIWAIKWERINRSFDHFFEFWIYHFNSIVAHVVTFGAFLFVFFKSRRLNLFVWSVTSLLLLGAGGYFIVFFMGFPNHDYQFTNTLIAPVFIWTFALFVLKKRFPRIFYSPFSLVLLMGLMIYNINFTKDILNSKEESFLNDHFRDNYSQHKDIAKELENLGLEKDDYIISIPDGSPNISLYMLNRKGWSNYGSNFKDTTVFKRRIEQGASFIVVNDSAAYSQFPINLFTDEIIFDNGDTQIFSLKKAEELRQIDK